VRRVLGRRLAAASRRKRQRLAQLEPLRQCQLCAL
jgi:hypothetical protein